MPLEKQVVDVLLTGGLETRKEGRLFVPGELSRLENFVASNNGVLNRRAGSTRLGSIPIAGSVADMGGLVPFGNQLVALAGPKSGAQPPVAYLPSNSQFASVLNATNVVAPGVLRRTPIIRNGKSQFAADVATFNGKTVYAYSEGLGTSAGTGLHVSVWDEATGTPILGDTAIATTTTAPMPRVVATSSAVLVFWVDGVNLKCVVISAAGAVGSVFTLRTDVITSQTQVFDAVATGATVAVAYASSSTQLTVISVSSAGAVLGSPAPTNISVGASPYAPRVSYSSAASALWVICTPGATGPAMSGTTKAIVLNPSTFATITALFTVRASVAAGTPYELTRDPSSATTTLVCYSGGATAVTISTSAVVSAGVTLTGMVLVATPTYLQSGASKQIVFAVIDPFTTDLQPTIFLVNTAGVVLARILPGIASWLSVEFVRPPSSMGDGTYVRMLLYEQERTIFLGGLSPEAVPVTTAGLSRMDFTPTAAAKLGRARLGDIVFVAGSAPQMYDGTTITEVGFHQFPEIAITPSLGGGGSLSAGAYQWRAHYEWTDHQGRVHRGAPSPAVSATASTGSTSAVLTIPTLKITSKNSQSGTAPISPPIIVLSRTTANGTIFYRVSDPNSPTYNDPTVGSVTITDTLSDAQLLSQQLLYTTGGVLDAIAPPACKYACAHQDRLFLAGLEDPYEIRYSTQLISGEFVRFNEDLALRVPQTTGEITGLASFDGELVITTQTGLYRLPGDGPDARGLNGTYPSEPIRVTADVGCLNAATIVELPKGLAFLTSKGLRLLLHGFSMDENWGNDMDGYAGYTFTSAVALSDQNQVRWQCSPNATAGDDVANGIALVFDTLYNQWAISTGYGAIDACLYGGKYTRLRSDGVVLQESASVWSDDGSVPNGIIETGWIKVGALQGFARVWRALFDGTIFGNCFLTVDVGYDFSQIYSGADEFTVAATGFAGEPFEFRRHLRIQKCRALRFRITVSSPSPPYQGISFAAVSLEAGMKRGATKSLPSSKTF